MSTKDVIQSYFSAIHKEGWEPTLPTISLSLAPIWNKIARGKAAYIEGAGCFFRLTTSVEVTHLILEGNTACAVARYQLRSPKGNTDVCDVAEILTVNVDKTDSSKIFFDTKAFQDFVAQG